MTNHLSKENSPYLLQHANNPVDWYPWCEEAIQKARSEDKPIFLSIGYAACHWCHVMAHESFEDAETAEVMNQYFINIKVDREERPDLDSIYMAAVVGMTGNGGWPMSVFLTHQGEPFFAGTYFPPVRRYNLPSFRDILLSVAQAWREQREQIVQAGQSIARQLASSAQFNSETTEDFSESTNQDIIQVLDRSYDWNKGGWGGAPKFPQPMVIEFLLRQTSRGHSGAKKMADHVLRQMAKGGMYDVLGGGFARYSTDEDWLVPHFEKMLYDNAQLALVYLHAYLLTGEPFFRRVCSETLDFVLRELTHPLGGFYSSLDADSEGEEGKFYLWSMDEIGQSLPDRNHLDLVLAAYGITSQGNLEGRTIFQRQLDDATLAEQFKLSQEEVASRLETCRIGLLEARSRRERPATDDKVLVAWNALMLTAFAEAGRYLGRADYIVAAERNAAFLLEQMHPQERLLRSWRDGQARHNAYLEDYAALILGSLALYETNHEVRWYQAAESLAEEMLAHFRDPSGGFFDTRDDHEHLLTRPKDLQDNATPCGNALASLALLELSALNGNETWRQISTQSFAIIYQAARRYPTAFGFWLSAIDFSLGPVQEAAILGDPDLPQTQALIQTLWKTYRPRLVAAISAFPPAQGSPPLLVNRFLVKGKPTAYICQNFVCQLPVNSPLALAKQLDARPSSTLATENPPE